MRARASRLFYFVETVPMDTLEDLTRDAAKLRAHMKLYTREEYHEDRGPVVWWPLPVEEPPYVGSDLDEDFPEYSTHFSLLLLPDLLQQ